MGSGTSQYLSHLHKVVFNQTCAATVKSHKSEVLGTKNFILKY